MHTAHLSLKWSLPFRLSELIFLYISQPFCGCYMLCPTLLWVLHVVPNPFHPKKYEVNSTNYKVSYYLIFSSTLLLCGENGAIFNILQTEVCGLNSA
jgi:hypothetical protein